MNNDPTPSHYQLLGIDMSASPEIVREAIARLAEEADALGYTSPQQSRELWRRIRDIKTDLMSSSEQRYAYDRRLLAVAPSVAAPMQDGVDHRSRHVVRGATSPSLPVSLLRGAAVALVLALIGGYFLHRMAVSGTRARNTAVRAPLSPSLAASSLQSIGGSTSGAVAHLVWTPVPHATRYRVQINGDHGIRKTATVTQPAYSLLVMGPQTYTWRVQALVGNRWGAYSRSRQVHVSAPHGGAPVVVSPSNHALLLAEDVQLCWSPISHAVDYHLRVRGIGAMNVGSTCKRLLLQPGTYRWTVAPRLLGSRVVIGAYSAQTYFTIRQEVAVVQKIHHHARVRVRARKQSTRSQPIREVAALIRTLEKLVPTPQSRTVPNKPRHAVPVPTIRRTTLPTKRHFTRARPTSLPVPTTPVLYRIPTNTPAPHRTRTKMHPVKRVPTKRVPTKRVPTKRGPVTVAVAPIAGPPLASTTPPGGSHSPVYAAYQPATPGTRSTLPRTSPPSRTSPAVPLPGGPATASPNQAHPARAYTFATSQPVVLSSTPVPVPSPTADRSTSASTRVTCRVVFGRQTCN